MILQKNNFSEKDRIGIGTRILAGVCHNCGICPYADKRPRSVFGKLMRWHRGWCPAWKAHTTVYGVKSLSSTAPR